MEDDDNIYLCIEAQGITESKLNIQYTTDNGGIQTIRYDTFTNVVL